MVSIIDALPLKFIDIILALVDNNSQCVTKSVCTLFNKPGDNRKFDVKQLMADGSVELVKWAVSCGLKLTPILLANAAGGGNLEVIKWARKNGCGWDLLTCVNAAKGGHLEILKWARKNGCPWNSWTCAYAARGGHLETLKWARENGCPES